MRLVKGLAEEDADRIVSAVNRCGPFLTVESLWRASGVGTRALRCLARADAFRSMGLDRQQALWQIKPLRDEPLPLFESMDTTSDAGLGDLPVIAPHRAVLSDYESTGLSLKAHPVSFIRDELDKRKIVQASDLRSERLCPQGRKLGIAGLVLCRQRPGTASGVVFITLEDETGIANLIVWSDTFERYRRVARLSTILIARGAIERQGEVVHLHVKSLESADGLLPTLTSISRDFH
jgi:error-prone DNA polymerase